MTPQELLKATEAAAGDKDLVQWHEDLIVKSKELKKMSGVRQKQNGLS